jgi:hypothetical protein
VVADAEVIDGEAVEVPSAVVVHPASTTLAHVQSGVGQIMQLTDEEFERNLAMLAKGYERGRRMQKEILREGTDYGTEPGVNRPFLHKPGAETFEKAYGLATTYTVERLIGDGEERPDLEFIVHARVHLGTGDGPVVAEGLGEASTWERKYRYRSGSKKCPKCGADAIRRGTKKDSTELEWYCWAKQGGCGARFAVNDPALAQAPDDVENPDPWDLANTLLKMARKRAYVDGILTATGTSGLFTQDEDSPSVRRAPAPDNAPRTTGQVSGDPGPAGAADEEAPGPGTWTGAIEKVDGPRKSKIEWIDGAKVVHDKFEVKIKARVEGRLTSMTAILVDSLALAAAEGNLAVGEYVSFDGDYHEHAWAEGKPKIKQARRPAHLWRYRAKEWQELNALSAPTHAIEDMAAEAEHMIAEEAQLLAQLDDLPGQMAPAPERPPTWDEETRALAVYSPVEGSTHEHVGYFISAQESATANGSPVWTGVVGVPRVGLFQVIINAAEADTVGLTAGGKPAFRQGSLVKFSGTGWHGRIILAGIGPEG